MTLITRIRVLYFVKSMMFSMLGFSSISAIIVTAVCGLSYSAWIDVPGCGGHVSSGSLSHGGFLSLNISLSSPRVSKAAGFIDVGQNFHVFDDVISYVLWTRVRTNCGNCLADDIQDNTTWELLQYMTSHLVFVSCSVSVRYSDNCAPKSAANNSSRGRVCVLMGATLVLAIVNAMYISAPDIPLR